MSSTVIIVLSVGSFVAGWVDALVGGGGLILLPLILVLNPQLSVAQALATNKLAAISGTTSAAIKLVSRLPSAKKALRFTPLAMLGAAGGAIVASSLNKAHMRPVIIVLLLAVGVFMLFKPEFGQSSRPQVLTGKVWAAVFLVVAAISFYDGIFGPGTGLFLIFGFTAILGGDFITSAAWSKVINASTNLGALLAFIIHGEVLWLLGMVLALANIVGAQLGAHMILGKGAQFLRVVMLVVVVVMTTKLVLDHLGISL